MNNIAHLCVVGTIICTVYGQLILKWRISFYGPLPDSFYKKIMFLIGLVADPYILSGFVAAFIASLFWMAAMTRLELSMAYPFMSASFALVMLFSIAIFGEPVTWHKAVGLLLIGAGIAVIGHSR